MSHRFRRLPGILLAMLALLVLSIVGTPASAQTSGNWLANALPNFEYSNVFASPSGDVAQVGCSGNNTTGDETSGPYIYNYDPVDGAATSNVSGVFRESVVDCDQGSTGIEGTAVGADGTIYAVQHDYDHGYISKLQAYKNGLAQWTNPLQVTPLSGCSGRVDMLKVHVGTDGDLYFIGLPPSYSCPHKAYVFGVDAATGMVKFQKPITQSGTFWMGVHQDGLAVWRKNEKDEFYFFGYNGVEDTQRRFAKNLGSNHHMSHWMIHPNGTMYMAITGEDDATCADGNQVTASVVRRDPQGVEYTYDIYGFCKRAQELALTPDGGAVLLGADYYHYNNGDVLIHLRPDGSSSMTDIHRPGANLYSDGYPDFHVDVQGNILTVQHVGKDVYFTLFNSAGAKLAEYSTGGLRASQYDKFRVNYQSTAIAKGAVYAPVCFSDQYSSCRSDESPSYHKLLKANFVELDYAYPDAAILGYQSQPVEPLEVVIGGDSFTSGLGAGWYMPPSDANGCSRSSKAYGPLLDSDPSLPLKVTDFVACAGATTHSMQVGMNGEPGQLDAINPNTDVVVLTIGGNDVGFAEYVKACLIPFTGGCDPNTTAYTAILSKISDELPGKLDAVYEAISSKLGSESNAKVLVLGYPFVIREHVLGGVCAAELSQEEQQAAEAVTIALNDELSNAALRMQAKGKRFYYVNALLAGSPFNGHDMCSTDPFFNNWNISKPVGETAHPHEKGHGAYTKLVKDFWLSIN